MTKEQLQKPTVQDLQAEIEQRKIEIKQIRSSTASKLISN